MNKQLFLLRHGHSPFGERGADKERILSEQGGRDVSAMGSRLKKKEIVPNLVLCSTAQRTRLTAQYIMTAIGGCIDLVQYDDRLYNASVESLLDVVREQDKNINSLLIIGHNPGLSELVHFADGESSGRQHAFTGLATSSLAHLELSVPWSKLEFTQTKVVDILI
ncbi:MAG: histidine phosphatase family protein [Gammaproteobacteria bacterium]|nr:histidine phosphatase family protein [Gammaproteobacteria bacterium]